MKLGIICMVLAMIRISFEAMQTKPSTTTKATTVAGINPGDLSVADECTSFFEAAGVGNRRVKRFWGLISGFIESIKKMREAREAREKMEELVDKMEDVSRKLDELKSATFAQQQPLLDLLEKVTAFADAANKNTEGLSNQVGDLIGDIDNLDKKTTAGFQDMTKQEFKINNQIIDMNTNASRRFQIMQTSLSQTHKMLMDYWKNLDADVTQVEEDVKDQINQVEPIMETVSDEHKWAVLIATRQNEQMKMFDTILSQLRNAETTVDNLNILSGNIGNALNVTSEMVGFISQRVEQLSGEISTAITRATSETEEMTVFSKFGKDLNRIEYLRYWMQRILPLQLSPDTNSYSAEALLWAQAVLKGGPESKPMTGLITSISSLIQGNDPDLSILSTKSVVELYLNVSKELANSDEGRQSVRWYLESMLDELMTIQHSGLAMQIIAQLIQGKGANTPEMLLNCRKTTKAINDQSDYLGSIVGRLPSAYFSKDPFRDATLVASFGLASMISLPRPPSEGIKLYYPLNGCRFCINCSPFNLPNRVTAQCVFQKTELTNGNKPERVIDLDTSGQSVMPNDYRDLPTKWNPIVGGNQTVLIDGFVRVEDKENQFVCGVGFATMAGAKSSSPAVLYLKIQYCSKATNLMQGTKSAPTKLAAATAAGFNIATVQGFSYQWVVPQPFGWVSGIALTGRRGLLEFVFETAYK